MLPPLGIEVRLRCEELLRAVGPERQWTVRDMKSTQPLISQHVQERRRRQELIGAVGSWLDRKGTLPRISKLHPEPRLL